MARMFRLDFGIHVLLLVLFTVIFAASAIHSKESRNLIRKKLTQLMDPKGYTPGQYAALPETTKIKLTERGDHQHTLQTFKQVQNDLYVIRIASVLGLVCTVASLVVTLRARRKNEAKGPSEEAGNASSTSRN